MRATFSIDHNPDTGYWTASLTYDGRKYVWLYPGNLNIGKVREDVARLISLIRGDVRPVKKVIVGKKLNWLKDKGK